MGCINEIPNILRKVNKAMDVIIDLPGLRRVFAVLPESVCLFRVAASR
jgi:hypothetical protein